MMEVVIEYSVCLTKDRSNDIFGSRFLQLLAVLKLVTFGLTEWAI